VSLRKSTIVAAELFEAKEENAATLWLVKVEGRSCCEHHEVVVVFVAVLIYILIFALKTDDETAV
jgi:hypothetical protein